MSLQKSKGLPKIKELEGLWYALQQEMTAQGEVKTFTGKIVGSDGIAGPAEITRVGPFTAISDNRFLRYAGDGKFVELGRQPPARFMDGADDLLDADPGELTAGVVDPSRGQFWIFSCRRQILVSVSAGWSCRLHHYPSWYCRCLIGIRADFPSDTDS